MKWSLLLKESIARKKKDLDLETYVAMVEL
jgi:hypothetical protein